MTPRKFAILATAISATALAAGCAADNAMSTATIADEKKTAVAKIDPACVAIATQIDSLRAEGAIEGLEKAASGKTTTVKVKRSALAKQAELNAANTEFQAKCGSGIQHAAAAAPPATTATVAQAPAKPADAAPAQPKN